MSRLAALVSAGVVILAVVGCGESANPADEAQRAGDVVTTQPTPSDSTGSPGATPPSSPATPTPSFTEDLPVTPPPAGRGRLITLRGTVQAGVEAGCLIVSTAEGTFQLVGPRTGGLKAGMTVEVKGAPDETIATTCQQGVPFVVTEVEVS
jgi:hypothetical protein